MTLDGLDKILGLFYLVLAMYVIIGGILATMASGFKFYFVACLVGGVPLILVSFLVIMSGIDDGRSKSAYMLMAWSVLMFMKMFWERIQQGKARMSFPDKWSAWEYKRNHASPLKRFIYPAIV